MPDQPIDPLQALSKASSIGAAQPGDRYAPAPSDSLLQQLVARVVGAGRPSSVAAADPYGIGAYLKGAGPVPLMAGTMEPQSAPLFKRVGRSDLLEVLKEATGALKPGEHYLPTITAPPGSGKPALGAGLLGPHPAINSLLDVLSHDPYASDTPAQIPQKFFAEAKGKQAIPGMRQEARLTSLEGRPDTVLTRPSLHDLHAMDVRDKLSEAPIAPLAPPVKSRGGWIVKRTETMPAEFESKFSQVADLNALGRALRKSTK